MGTFDNSGSLTVKIFEMSNSSGFSGPGPSVSSGTSFEAGTYDLSETGPAGYSASEWVCTGGSQVDGNTVEIGLGENVACSITNNDQAGTLIVKKVVVNDNGGKLTAKDFSFKVNGGSLVPFEADGQNDITVNAGVYTVTEPAVTGYTTTYSNCTDVVVPNGGSQTCVITNDDQSGTIIVEKQTDPDGMYGEFTFTGDAAGKISDNGQIVVSGLSAGTYTSTEVVPAGWQLTGIVCSDANSTGSIASATATFNLENGETVKCVFTDDPLPTVALDKSVDVNSLPEPGGDFHYTVTIANTSFEPVTITAIHDSQSNACDGLKDTEIPVGGAVTCSYTIHHTEAGTYPNTASVTVKDGEGNPASDSDSEL